MRTISTALIILFAAIVLIFCIQNLETVKIAFLGWGLHVPLAVLILIVYLLGMFTGGGLFSFLRHSIEKARHKKE